MELAGLFTPLSDPVRIANIRMFCGQIWGTTTTPQTMPCSNPCSLMRSDLSRLHRNQYWVGEKTDGVRMFLVMDVHIDAAGEEHEYAVLVDRAFRMFNVLLEAPEIYYTGSLFDGELVVIDSEHMFYVPFDVVAASGYSLKAYPYSQRTDVTRTAFDTIQFMDPPIVTRPKLWHPLTDAVKVFTRAENCDGLILVPELGELVNGTQSDTFKWKEAQKHTIDFLLDGAGKLWNSHGGQLVNATVALKIKFSKGYENYTAAGEQHPVLVECRCVPTVGKNEWSAIPVKMRTDKNHPNSLHVARLTLQNIQENIQLSELIQ